MDLRPDALQAQLARGVAATLAKGGDAWTRSAELGVPALGLPAAAGGLDLGLSAEIVAAGEMGRALAPLAGHRETMLAAGVLVEVAAGSPFLSRIAAGEVRLAAAGLGGEPAPALDGAGRLRGRSAPLPAVAWDGALVRARGEGRDALLLVELPAAGCRSEAVETVAGPEARLVFDGAAGLTLLEDGAGRALERPVAAARVRQAALLLGVARAAGRAARDRAAARRQFGRRLIEFQSVGHRLAALAGELEGVTLLVHEAAWRWDGCLPPEPSAAQALAAAAELALGATRLAVQVHGAAGMLTGSIPERAYRLAGVEATRLGTPGALWWEAGSRRLAMI
ncbi:MAG TPA: acyl-CoA dehydrogenase [Candidatus Dormibacteraeota bacterium]